MGYWIKSDYDQHGAFFALVLSVGLSDEHTLVKRFPLVEGAYRQADTALREAIAGQIWPGDPTFEEVSP